MLVLTRRIRQEIVIAGNIRLTVLSVDGDRVRLGITAPLSVHVARAELLADPTTNNHPAELARAKQGE